LFARLGAKGAALALAIACARVASPGAAAVWLVNLLAAVLRGAGNKKAPSAVLWLTAVAQVVIGGVSGLGLGPVPHFGMAGAAAVQLVASAIRAALLVALLRSGRAAVTLAVGTVGAVRLQGVPFGAILRTGATAAVSPIMSITAIILLNRGVAGHGPTVLAGFGNSTRLEFLPTPLGFAIGAAQRSRRQSRPPVKSRLRGTMLVLGIESSCDETAVALVRGDRTVVAQRIASQDEAHRPFGGVVPELAARAHVDRLTPMVADVLQEAGMTLADIDAVAATAGPGLIGGVMVGLVTGKALAFAAGKPLLAINHLEGHALSPRLSDAGLGFPYLLLLVSGGHCQLLGVEGVGRYRRLATTIDDAIGEAFDKTAKVLGLGFPGGPAVERAAARGNARRFVLPRPLLGRDEPHFSFAGLKSAVLRQWQALGQAAEHASGQALPEQDETARDDLAAAFQQAATDCLVDRTARALRGFPQATALVVAGGVASNQHIRSALSALAAQHGTAFVAPPLWLCTDNAAMIAWAGVERLALSAADRAALGLVDGLEAPARPRWPLDPGAEPVRGAGVRA